MGLTIVGIGYNSGHGSLYRASQIKTAEERFLFLIPDVGNAVDANAIMIHDGKQKLGYVSASEAPQVKALFRRWSAKDGYDSVIVCDIGWMSDHARSHMRKTNTVTVTGIYRVHERLARKYAAKQTF